MALKFKVSDKTFNRIRENYANFIRTRMIADSKGSFDQEKYEKLKDLDVRIDYRAVFKKFKEPGKISDIPSFIIRRIPPDVLINNITNILLLLRGWYEVIRKITEYSGEYNFPSFYILDDLLDDGNGRTELISIINKGVRRRRGVNECALEWGNIKRLIVASERKTPSNSQIPNNTDDIEKNVIDKIEKNAMFEEYSEVFCNIAEKMVEGLRIISESEDPLSFLIVCAQEALRSYYGDLILKGNLKRFDRGGLVYTPFYISRFMIKSLNWLFKNKFGKDEGLFSDDIRVVDPCMGSLIFEFDYYREFILNDTRVKGEIYGIDIDFFSYLAGIILFEDVRYFARRIENNDTKITYSEKENPFSLLIGFGNVLDKSATEFFQSEKFFSDKSHLAVIGNPPYSVSSKNRNEWIHNLIHSYLVKEPNTTRLYDDYVKFIRVFHNLFELFSSKDRSFGGIIAFITNRKFLDGKIYYGMRKSLIEFFNEIHVIDLHGDMRNIKKDKGEHQNIFGILTGIAVIFLVKSHTPVKRGNADVIYHSIRGKTEKIRDTFLKLGDLGGILYHQLQEKKGPRKDKSKWESEYVNLHSHYIEPKAPKYLFVPILSGERIKKIWFDMGYSVKDCFIKTSRAFISSRDRFMINVNPEILKMNIYDLSNRRFDSLRSRKIISKKNKDKLLENEDIIGGFDYLEMEKSIDPINYRPFDIRYCIYYTINKKCGKSTILDDIRPSTNDIAKDDGPEYNIGSHDKSQLLIVNLNPDLLFDKISGYLSDTFLYSPYVAFNFVQSVQKPPFGHILITYGLVDSGLFGYSTSKAAPLRFSENNGKRLPNISKPIISILEGKIERFKAKNIEIDDLNRPHYLFWAYLYGFLHLPQYAEVFNELLLHEFPRVIFNLPDEIFLKVADAGYELILLHLIIPLYRINPTFNRMINTYILAKLFENNSEEIAPNCDKNCNIKDILEEVVLSIGKNAVLFDIFDNYRKAPMIKLKLIGYTLEPYGGHSEFNGESPLDSLSSILVLKLEEYYPRKKDIRSVKNGKDDLSNKNIFFNGNLQKTSRKMNSIIKSSKAARFEIRIQLDNTVLAYSIGSIKPILRYIKDRLYTKIKSPFEADDFIHLLLIIHVIEKTVSIREGLRGLGPLF